MRKQPAHNFAIILGCGLVSSAMAQMQGGWLIEAANTVSVWRPSTEVELWGWFANIPGPTPIFSYGDLDLHAQCGVFDTPHFWLGKAGTVQGSSVVGLKLLNLNCFAGIYGYTANPILLWASSWATSDFSPRSVPVWTDHTTFFYVDDRIGGHCTPITYDLVALGGFVPGEGVIEVIDACYADCDLSGALDLFDFLCYVNAFNASNMAADCDGSGSLDVFDFLCYVGEFTAGCP